MRPPPSFWAFLIVLAVGSALAPAQDGFAYPGNSSKPAPGDWPQFHFDARNSGFNPFERILGPANVRSLRQSWSASTTSRFAPDPVVWGGKVYVAPTDGIVRAFDATTGELIWSTDTHSEIDAVAPAVADGVLYVGTERGVLWALDADTGGLVWSERLGDAIFYPATVVGSVVYVSFVTNGGADEVTEALDAATGTALWAQTVLAGDAPAVGNGMVYMAGALGATVYALDA